MQGQYLRTTDIAYAVAVHPNTVRQYEVWGLLPPIPRSPSGYRLFTEFHLDQMRLARSAMEYTWLGKEIGSTGYEMIYQAASGDLGGALERAYQLMVLVQTERAQAEVAVSLLERWAQGAVTDATIRSMRIGEVAHYLNVTSDMLRNWERNGLLQVPRNPKNGYRMYGAREIGRLRVIRVLSRSRYSMMAILRMLLQLDGGQIEGLRRALDTPEPGEDIGHVTDKWLTTLVEIEARVKDTLAQLDMMLQKGVAKVQTLRGESVKPGGRAVVVKQFSRILADGLDILNPHMSTHEFRLYGPAAGLLQGVFQPVRNISLMAKSRSHVDAFSQLMRDYPQIEPPGYIDSEKIYRAVHLIRGVEFMMGVPDESENKYSDLDAWHHYTSLKIGSHIVCAEALELRLAIELDNNRPRHYAPLIKHMQKHGADSALAQRAMESKTLYAEKISEILLNLKNVG